MILYGCQARVCRRVCNLRSDPPPSPVTARGHRDVVGEVLMPGDVWGRDEAKADGTVSLVTSQLLCPGRLLTFGNHPSWGCLIGKSGASQTARGGPGGPGAGGGARSPTYSRLPPHSCETRCSRLPVSQGAGSPLLLAP